MPTYWDATQTLNLYGSPGAAPCSGITKRGARCWQHMFSQADRSKTAAILAYMSQCQPQLGFALGILEDLAYLTLCQRWHRKPGYSQVQDVTRRFERTIEAYCTQLQRAGTRETVSNTRRIERPPTRRIELVEDLPLPIAARTQQRRLLLPPSIINESPSASHTEAEAESESQPNESSPTNTTSSSRLSAPLRSHHRQPQAGSTVRSQPQQPIPSSSASPSRSSSQTSSSPTSQSLVARDDQLRDTEEQQQQQQQLVTPSSSTSSTPRLPPVITNVPRRREPAPADRGSHMQTPPATPPTADATISTLTSPLTPASERPPSALPAIPSDPTINTTTNTTTTTTTSGSLARKPLTEPCCICLEPIISLSSSVYCRRQCGTNVHRECFGTWRSQCLLDWDARDRLEAGMARDLAALGEHERRRTESVSCVYCRTRWMWEWEE